MRSRTVIALPWITRTEWRAWQTLDPATLPATYEDWLNAAQQRVYDLTLSEQPFELVATHAAKCAAWCRRRGIPVDADGRQAYADSRLSAGKSSRKGKKRVGKPREGAGGRAASPAAPGGDAGK